MNDRSPFVEQVLDPRYSPEFYRRLETYFGGGPEQSTSPDQRHYLSWWRDHAGGRVEFFRQHLIPALEKTRPIDGLKILDFGCGTGCSSVALAERGATVVGVDPDRTSLRVAEQRVIDLRHENRITLRQIQYLTRRDEKLPLPDASFDLATMFGVLEHAYPHEWRHCVRELTRLIKPGGEVFLCDTPNRMFPYDHHTTKLWFVGWMPQRFARAYALGRGRIDKSADFQRRGGVGVSRRAIDAVFPSSEWTLVHEKSAQEVLWELKWAASQTPVFLSARPLAAAGLVIGTMWPIIQASRLLNMRQSAWTASHVLTYRKRG